MSSRTVRSSGRDAIVRASWRHPAHAALTWRLQPAAGEPGRTASRCSRLPSGQQQKHRRTARPRSAPRCSRRNCGTQPATARCLQREKQDRRGCRSAPAPGRASFVRKIVSRRLEDAPPDSMRLPDRRPAGDSDADVGRLCEDALRSSSPRITSTQSPNARSIGWSGARAQTSTARLATQRGRGSDERSCGTVDRRA